MPANYYYLVASLPDLLFDSPKKVISLAEFINDISGLVTPAHAQLLKLFRLFYDNTNLINLLAKNKKEHDARGAFSKEELEREIKYPETLPQYIRTFLEAYKSEKLPFPNLLPQDQLAWLYYDELTSHPEPFIRQWFSFDLNLRNLLAAINMRKMEAEAQEGAPELSLSKYIICRNDFSQQLLKSRAPDFSLSVEHRWVEKIISLNRQNLVEFEKSIDQLRWQTVNELTVFSGFQIETILAFCIKLESVERWQRLKPDVGEEMLGRLLAGLKPQKNIMVDIQ